MGKQTTMTSKHELRQELRAKRQQLTIQQKQQAAEQIAQQLLTAAIFSTSKKIAGYLASDGEVDLSFVMHASWAAQKDYYLPILHPANYIRLWFAHYEKNASLQANRYGIMEPFWQTEHLLAPWALDLVLVPLVGFDTEGNRLGMGKGFYDQTFAFLQQAHRNKPRLIGVAYELQKVAKLQINDWDIPLHGIVTEKQFYNL